MKKSAAQIIISSLALLNVIFVPVFDVWGGLFPDNPEYRFFDVMEYVFKGEFDTWVIWFTLLLFVPSVFMFIFSVIGFKTAAWASSLIGIVLMNIALIKFVFDYEISYLFDFDDGNICIGLWIGLGLFIAMLFIRPKTENKIIHCTNCGYNGSYKLIFDPKLLTWENIKTTVKKNIVVCILLMILGFLFSWLLLTILICFVIVKCTVYKICPNCKNPIKKANATQPVTQSTNQNNS